MAPSCRTHTHTQLDNIISAKVCHKNGERIYATLKIEIYCKRNLWQMPKSKKKNTSKFPLANAKKIKGKAELKNRLDLQLIVARDIDECSAQLVADSR